jgi:hypothetical protein
VALIVRKTKCLLARIALDSFTPPLCAVFHVVAVVASLAQCSEVQQSRGFGAVVVDMSHG